MTFDKRRADAAENIDLVILSQFPDWDGESISASDLYMSEEIQEILKAYIQKRFKLDDKSMSYLYLDKFPTSVPWKHPDCTCPVMDNRDAGFHMYFDADCKVHKR